MQITCEKCQTSYAVDDGLIPAAGAPVQCTKCGNLFTAYPPAAARPAGRTVMMFADDPVPTSQRATAPGFPRSDRAPVRAPAPAPAQTQPFAPMPDSPPPAVTQPFEPVREPWPVPVARTQPFAPVPAPTPQPTAPAKPIQSGAGPVPKAPAKHEAVTELVYLDPKPASPIQTSPRSVDAIPTLAPSVVSSELKPQPPATLGATFVAPQREAPAATSRPGKMTQMFFNQGDVVDRVNEHALKEAKGEAHRKPGQTQMFMAAANFEERLVRKSRTPLYLGLGAAGLVVAGIAAAVFVPPLLGPPGANRQAVTLHDQALKLLRRDDAKSLQAADEQFAKILAKHPHYIDAQADRALALEFRADDLTVQVRRLRATYEALDREVGTLNKRKEPADWMQRVNADIGRLKQMHSAYDPLAKQEEDLGNRAFALAQGAFKADPHDRAAQRALAFYYADRDDADRTHVMLKNYLKSMGKKDGWSELAEAELDASGRSSEQKRTDGKDHLADALRLDPGLLRAKLIAVQLDASARDLAAVKQEVAALALANPDHGGGALLEASLLDSLARAKADSAEKAARLAEQAKGAQAAENPEAHRLPEAPAKGAQRRSRRHR